MYNVGMLTRYFSRFPHALRGITYAAKNDFGYRTQVYGIGLFVVAILFYLSPLSKEEFLFLLLAYALILITELQNSALEIALDRLHPDLHDAIGKSKDMAAGAVLLAGVFLTVVILSFLYARFPIISSFF
jgi:diacylglycerol kinase